MKDKKLTHTIIGAGMKIHNTLGNGFQELIYSRCMAHELRDLGLSFKRDMEMPVYYKRYRAGTRRVDFFVEDLIMLELKAVVNLKGAHISQGINYLEAYHMDIGLLINFGAKNLEYKRLYNTAKTRSAME